MIILWARNKRKKDSERITNFGGNVSFVPQYRYAPKTEADVLDILDRHANDKIRVVGSLHSWSDVVETDQVSIDMRHFDSVDAEKAPDGEVYATVGAGSVLKNLVSTLDSKWNVTLPTIGAVTQQTISGVVSTATHGSGMSTLSHYMDEMRVAAYDAETGKAKVYVWKEGRELRAARCAIGCMGVILSVKFRCVPQYYVEEKIASNDSLQEILAQENDYPLQQFGIIPYSWSYFSFQRRVVNEPMSPRQIAHARIQRVINLTLVDVLFHGIIKLAAANLDSPRKIKYFYESMFLVMMRQRAFVDQSDEVLTFNHQLYKHLEMEISVPAKNIIKATELMNHATTVFAGDSDSVPQEIEDSLKSIGMFDALMEHKGAYAHHYPIAFRLVKPDDALISMSSGDDAPYYAISLFTYIEPRDQFYGYAGFLARSLTLLYDARLHWGKYFPLTNREIEHLYPQLEEFRETCNNVDPNGVFRNEYTKRVLGF